MNSKAKSIVLIAVAIVLTAIAVKIAFFGKNTTLDTKAAGFAVKDTADIVAIRIQTGSDTLLLERSGAVWKANKHFLVNKKAIFKALETLRLIDIKAPLPDNAVEPVSKKLDKAKKITIFFTNGKTKTIFLGKQTSDKSGNFAKIENYKPFIIFVPSYEIDLNRIFTTNPEYWREKNIFHFNPADIVFAEVKYFDNPENSFKIVKSDTGDYFIETGNKKITNPDKDNLFFYLSHFHNVNYVKNLEKNSVQPEQPIFTISIRDRQGFETEITAFEIINSEGKPNKDFFIGLLNGKDYVLCKFYDFDLLLKTPDYFIKQIDD